MEVVQQKFAVCPSTDFACWVSCFFQCGVVVLWILFSLDRDNRRVLSVWAKKRKKNNQRSAGFFRYLFEKSESKNHWVPVISNTSKNRQVS